jgi:glyoxylase-like metal-dependent hydrolase (beta-lactamase superfamily II)
MTILVENKEVRIEKLDVGGSLWANAYLITCIQTGESAIIDAPGKPDVMLEQVRGKNVKYILMTNNYSDHIGALAKLRSALKAQVCGHSQDADGYPILLTLELNDGDKVAVGKLDVKVIHTPGHTGGSLCFLVGNYLFSGDTLLPGGPGYTTSPANLEEILISLIRKIFVLPDETIVYPGHGAPMLLGKENSAFNAFASRKHSPGLCGDVFWDTN